MRQFLITKLVCSKCGNNLNMTYSQPPDNSSYVEGEPTGAAKLELLVPVEPCRTCAAPAKDLARALNAVMKSDKEAL